MKNSLKLSLMSLLVLTILISPMVLYAQENGESSEDYQIAIVPKISGIPWFNRMKQGVQDAAEDFNVDAFQQGPSQADPAQQVQVVENLVARDVDAIAVVPNDAQSLGPAFEDAREKGIKVLTHESPFFTEVQDYDIETINNTTLAKKTMDQVAERTGGEGGYAMFVGSLTVPLHNYWADTAVEYAKEEYPGLELLTERLPVAESQEDSYRSAQDLIRTYGQELDAIIGWGSLGPIGAGQAVREKGLTDEIVVGGFAIPSQAAPYLADGAIDWIQLWDPADAGYAMVYVAKQMIEGNEIEEGMEIPGLGEIKINGKTISVDSQLFITDPEKAEEMGF